MTVGRIILRVKKAHSNGILKLECRNGWIWKDHSRNFILYHLPDIDGIVNPNLNMIPITLKCMLCSRTQGATTMILCDVCLIC